MADPSTSSNPTRMPRTTVWALVVAGLWGVGLVVAAFTAPLYTTTSVSISDEGTPAGTAVETTSTSTLIEENGNGALGVVSLPIGLTVATALAIRSYTRTRSRNAGRLAWVLAASLALLNVLSLMTIGVLIIPATLALLVACRTGVPLKGVKPT